MPAGAHGGYGLARGDDVARLHLHAAGLQVGEERHDALAGSQAVRDHHELAPSAVAARFDHHAVGGCPHLASARAVREIEPEMAIVLALYTARERVAAGLPGAR